MIFNAVGGGGAAEKLGFQVVGGATQPTNPAANTVWVKTSAAITSWAMQPTAPASPSAGMVWIKTALSGGASLNALTKNALTVAVVGCQQYNGTAWERRDAYLYSGSDWMQFSAEQLILFDVGGDYAAEWEGGGMASGAFTWGYSIATQSATIADTGIVLVQGYNSSVVRYIAGYSAPVDVTDLDSIYIQVNTTGAANEIQARLTENKTISGGVAASAAFNTTGDNAYTLDVSGLTGEYYLSVSSVKSSSLGGNITAKITKVWCE